jgi:hypothetical protein
MPTAVWSFGAGTTPLSISENGIERANADFAFSRGSDDVVVVPDHDYTPPREHREAEGARASAGSKSCTPRRLKTADWRS